jgi:hypothetical protein
LAGHWSEEDTIIYTHHMGETTSFGFADSVVSYCDVVRFSEWVAQAEQSPAVLEALVSTLQDVHEWMRGLSESSPLSLNTSMVSDSFILSRPGPFKSSFDAVAEATMVLQCNMIERGAFIRGAVSTGRLYHNDGIAVGIPLVEAVALEEHDAAWPRVVLHPSVVRGLYSHSDRKSATLINLFDPVRYVVKVHDWYQLDPLVYVYNVLSFRGLFSAGEYDREWKPLQATFIAFKDALKWEVDRLRESRQHTPSEQKVLMGYWLNAAEYLNGAVDRTLQLLDTALKYRQLPGDSPLGGRDPLFLVWALHVSDEWRKASIPADIIAGVFHDWWSDRETEFRLLQSCTIDVPYLKACWDVRPAPNA